MKPSVLILFPSEWAAYSPTLLNLVALLQSRSSTTVIAFDNTEYDNRNLDKSTYSLIHIPRIIFRLLAALHLYKLAKYIALRITAARHSPDIVIGIDSIGICAALATFKTAHFISLEVERDCYLKQVNISQIKTLAIQSIERRDFLFPDLKPRTTILLPNAPILKNLPSTRKHFYESEIRLIFMGNAIPSHGIYACCEAVMHLSQCSLTIKGIIHPKIREHIEHVYRTSLGSRIILDTDYLTQDDVIEYLERFDIGFCFYDFRIISADDFNYLSSPSGKMFNYFAAGVPVIGSNVIGLKPVVSYDAGILIESLDSNTVCSAINRVIKNIHNYRMGCIKAAYDFNFSRHADPYISAMLADR